MTEEASLFPPGSLPYPRPQRNSDSVIRAAVEDILPDVMVWAGDGDRDVLRDDLVAALKLDRDTYGTARHLEQERSWVDVDDTLLDILSRINVTGHYDRAVEKWVAENTIKPTHVIGDRVRFYKAYRINGEPAGLEYVGIIDRIDAKRAEYGISIGERNSWCVVRFEHVIGHADEDAPLGEQKASAS